MWAKELHKLIFGDRKASYLFEGQSHAALLPPGEGAAAAGAAPADDESSYMRLVQTPPAAGAPASEFHAWAVELCVGVFHDDIAKVGGGGSVRGGERGGGGESLNFFFPPRATFPLRRVQRLSIAADSYKTAKHRPVPIDVRATLASAGADVEGAADAAGGESVLAEQRVLTPAGSLRLFVETLVCM